MRASRTCLTLAAVFVLASLPAMPAAGSAGDLDPSFDGDGKVVTAIGTIHDVARAIAIQPDGKIVVAGSVRIPADDADFAVARYNPDGTLDATFSPDGDGIAGIAITDFGTLGAFAYGVALQDDGKIVAAGYTNTETGPDIALARYNPDGTPDGTFGGGVVTTDLGGGDYPTAVALQGDGKIVVSGETIASGVDFDIFVARYTVEGALDPTFGGAGSVLADFGDEDYGGGVAVHADGKVVAAGTTAAGGGDFAIARFLADGTPDPGFGTDGKVTTSFWDGPDEAWAVAVQGDGKIVAAGWGTMTGDFALARYLASGALDPTFDDDGKATADIGGFDVGKAVAIDPATGRIVVAGRSTGPTTPTMFAVARFQSDGDLDPLFSGDGKTTTGFGEGPDEANAVAIQDDSKIVAAGRSDNGTDDDFALARYGGTSELTLTLVPSPDHVWANGRKKALLTATVTSDGVPVAGVEVALSAAPSEGVTIGPGFDPVLTTDGEGKATFEATSNKIDADFKPREVTFTASVVDDPSTTGVTKVTFEPHKIVVQFLGVDTTLSCKPTGACVGDLDTFAPLRKLLKGISFEDDDLLWYSYRGGFVSAVDGRWYAKSYKAVDTAQAYFRSIIRLDDLIDEFAAANPNSIFYLVGHSQGGLIAFQELAQIKSLPAKSKVAAIFTFDSPLGGSPRPHVEFAQLTTDWDGPANKQLIQLYASARAPNRQGATVTMLCVLVGGICDFGPGTTNAGAVAARPKVKVVTYGNEDDAVYRASKCNLTDPYYAVPNTGSQVIKLADLESLGGNSPKPPEIDDFDVLEGLWKKAKLKACISNSHHKVSSAKAGLTAGLIGHQYPM